jgi:hypothetical protein
LEQYEKAVGTPEAAKIKDKLKKDIQSYQEFCLTDNVLSH